jgi:hypothetical protein
MDKELLMELLPFFTMGEVNEELEANIDGSILKVSVIKKEDENKITMTLDFEQNENDEFKEYIDSLDEDIFIEACEQFEDLTGQHLSDEVNPELFKSVVKRVIENKINKLKEFI